MTERKRKLTSKIEPFDSFWEAPDDIEQGYKRFALFYADNYSRYFPADKDAKVLCVSCGPGYLVKHLVDLGYSNVVGIDSYPSKIAFAKQKALPCETAFAFDYLADSIDHAYDLIFCEQELNHLDKQEIIDFLTLCKKKLTNNGRLVCFALNGANPITGSEALAQNFDHHNTFTEYSLRQVLEHTGFHDIDVIPLNLYVFYKNPANYVAMFAAWLLTVFFRACFTLYGKKNRLFTKKIGAACVTRHGKP